MKALPVLIVLLCVLGAVDSAEAQFQRGRYSPSRTIPQAQAPPKKTEPPTAEEIVDAEMPRITEELGLDPFEEAVVRSVFIKYASERLELRNKNLQPRDGREAMEAIQERQDEEMALSLSPEKFQAYMMMREKSKKEREKEEKAKAKKAKKKKKKKNKEPSIE